MVRVANNLAAAQILYEEPEEAWGLLVEAESALVSLITASPGPDSELAVSLAFIKFNACVLTERQGDLANREIGESNERYAREALARFVKEATIIDTDSCPQRSAGSATRYRIG